MRKNRTVRRFVISSLFMALLHAIPAPTWGDVANWPRLPIGHQSRQGAPTPRFWTSEGLVEPNTDDRLPGYGRVPDLAGRTAGPTTTVAGLRAAGIPTGECAEVSTFLAQQLPLALERHSMIYDPVRDRLVVFGGVGPGEGEGRTDVWTLPLGESSGWRRLTTTGGDLMSPRRSAAAIHDGPRDRLIVFGGTEYGADNSAVWALDFSTDQWTDLAPSGPSPGARWGHSGIYDPARQRVIVFGGRTSYSGHGLADVWELSLTGDPAWARIPTSGASPFGREEQSAIYDEPRDRMIVFGGYSTEGPVREQNDLWALSLTSGAWTQLSPGGVAPAPRHGHAAVFDAPRERMLMMGGDIPFGQTLSSLKSSLVWSLSLSGPEAWTQLNPGGAAQPSPWVWHGLAYDSLRDRAVIFGGYGSSKDQVWTLGLSGESSPTWHEIVPSGQFPRGRDRPFVFYDSIRHRVLFHGGSADALLEDSWELSLIGSATWTRLVPAGERHTGAVTASAYDPIRNRLIVFLDSDNDSHALHVRVLSLEGSPTWTTLHASGAPPPPRSQPVAVYDPTRDRIVLFGGVDSLGRALNDVWLLSLAGSGTWSQMDPIGPAPALVNASAIYDRPRDRMVVLARFNAGGGQRMWALSFVGPGSWESIEAANAPYDGQMVFDEARNRAILTSEIGIVFALPLEGPARWYQIGLVPNGILSRISSQVFDAAGDRVLFFGNFSTNAVRSLTFPDALHSVSTVASPPSGGIVTLAPSGGCYSPGSATLTAEPAQGYQFTGWSGDAVGSANPLTVSVDGNLSILAHFEQPPSACGEWRQLVVDTGVLPIEGPAAAYDAARHRMIAVGLGHSGAAASMETWELELSGPPGDWRRIITTNAPSPVRWGSNAVYDAARDRLLMLGGWMSSGAIYEDLWALSLGGTPTWSLLNTVGGGPHLWGSLVHDPVRDRLVVFGGIQSFAGDGVLRNDVWELPLAAPMAWSEIAPFGTPPAGRFGGQAIYDPVRDRMILYAGRALSPYPYGDTWELRFGDSPTWALLAPNGTLPPGRSEAAAIYDPIRDRMIVYGGVDQSGVLEDVVMLSLKHGPMWIPLATGGTSPGARWATGSIYDPDNDRMIVANGWNTNGSSTFALSCAGGHWLDVTADRPAHGTVSRTPDSKCHPPGTVVTLEAFGTPLVGFLRWSGEVGTTTNPLVVTMNASQAILAEFDYATATAMSHFGAERVFDGVELRWRFVNPLGVLSSVVERGAQSYGPWQAIHPDIREVEGDMVCRDRTVTGHDDYFYRLVVVDVDSSRSTYGPLAVVGVKFANSDVSRMFPNPAVSTVGFEIVLAHAGSVRLSIHDLAGREVAVLESGDRIRGRFDAAWDGRGLGGPVPAGIYFVRFQAPDRTVTRRLALIR